MVNKETSVIVCHECDLLQQAVTLERGGFASCRRCGGVLYRNLPDSLNRTLAFTLAAAIFFIVANIYPVLGIEMQGNPRETNLCGAVHSLWQQEMHLISLLVGCTTILLPAFELGVMSYLLLNLRLGRVPAGTPLLMRVLQNVRPWSMVEVFLLGVLVSLVKLKSSSTIIPGVALWAFGGLTFMLAAMTAAFDPRDIWIHVEIGAPAKDEK